MSDIKTVWVNGYGEWVIEDGALASADDLETAVFISVFSDRQADAADAIPDGTTNRRGWWGDVDQDVKLGSRLWLLSRSILDDEVAKEAALYIKEGLQWMIDDEVAQSVAVTSTIVGTRQLSLGVTVTRTSGTRQFQYAWAWDQLT